ncbi:Kelch domain-containing protein [Pleurostoma richardsiae]|uniref:Kelch domain-containing protein n=1 Tax=Pleurostoma richardsiae TaxID=41990 RepID=A0AA38RP65_9PEZI|nr:Kelch domain-containing protein [Pleurostoma richardsiae]
MAFLFKSKKDKDRGLTSRDGPPGSQGSLQSGDARARVARDEKGSLQRSTPTGSLNSLDNEGSTGSPDQAYARRNPVTAEQQVQAAQQIQPAQLSQQPAQQPSDLQLRNGPATNPNNASLYPWSQRRLTYTSSQPSPFPRYGAAVNSVSSKEGDIYVMGGLINSSTVKGDLWMIEAGGSMSCYPLATTAEGPGPRVGHASLLVGNAFIVYGGDTKIDEADVLDETLYLLNTSTRQWSRALPAGPRPSGRYGHSLNILGSKIYIFGGQVEGYFMNDLAAFDLNQLQMPNNRWEILIQNSDSGGPPQGKIPPARTNHSVVTFNDKMYLFGGTNGFQWFNDVWCYDPATNLWTQLDCIGYIPVPREGHAAALVDDVMYIFGGRTEEGADLGDLAAFRITSRRWYTFQNMGPSPSPRSGHSMTAVNKSVVVVGGEPSTATTAVNDLALVYVLDTTKIRYPNDSQVSSQRAQGTRRPSASEAQQQLASRNLPSRDGSQGPPDSRKLAGIRESGAVNSPNGIRGPNGGDMNMVPMGPPLSKLPRAAGPPPQGQPPKPTLNTNAGRMRNGSLERNDTGLTGSPVTVNQTQSPIVQQGLKENDSPVTNGRRTPTAQVARSASGKESLATETPKSVKSARQGRSQGSVDSTTEPALKTVVTRPSSPPPPTRQTSNPLSRRSSGRNSQTVALLKELDAARNRNAWYASELELARKAGYSPNASLSPVLERGSAETFDDDDKPLIEALLAMRTELANVQASVDKQAVLAAKQIAEADKQRDAAIQEAVYAKAKLAAHMGSAANSPQLGNDRDTDDRSGDVSRKLAAALNTQRELQNQLERMAAEIEAERRARKLADDTVNAAQRRMADLESYKQQNSSEVERLKAELHMVQRESREQSVAAAEAVAAMQLLGVEKEELENRYNDAVNNSEENNQTFDSLKAALASSAEMKSLLEQKLEDERALRENAEAKLTKLKAEHEARTAELVTATQRLRDAEELAERHANEARTHQQAVLAGLDKLSARDAGKSGKADADRVAVLQGQVAAANALVKKYQQEADNASDRLRSAEERIAGLEAYQEQASREGVSIRRQLQSALRETQSLQALNSDLKHQLASQQLETNAMTVQHNTLKNILIERGISPTSAARSRGLSSPRDTSPEQSRVRDMEQQLAAAAVTLEETKQTFAIQAQESEAAYREKLSQLENDYQSAVHYVKGTEKMLKQLKEQLSRYKTENARLKEELVELEDTGTTSGGASAEWEGERTALQMKVDALQEEVKVSTAQLEKEMLAVREELAEAKRAREDAVRNSEEAKSRLSSSRKDLEQLQHENALLEQRAQDAEQKVSLLLDQVETSVDTYRRRSRQVVSMTSEQLNPPNVKRLSSNGNPGHVRQDSSEAESLYGGGGPGEARNSAALDSLANELETLRSHWEATNKNYRLSNNFDFETGAPAKKADKEDENNVGLSESLADWRKRLDD